ncbi:MAG TPA: PC4/YdbC family ssDNA-binding protein [Anaerovoracaceae bacterium]|nr:PC4/YdbC family ssDNA-binding protein [Anaerovoracaceae bacterium]
MSGKEKEKEKEKDREITFEVAEHVGIIGTSPTGWKKELNMVAWNGTAAKYDIREWDEDHTHMSRGITMNKDEIKSLSDILNGLQLQ